MHAKKSECTFIWFSILDNILQIAIKITCKTYPKYVFLNTMPALFRVAVCASQYDSHIRISESHKKDCSRVIPKAFFFWFL